MSLHAHAVVASDLRRELPWWARPSSLNLLFVLPMLATVLAIGKAGGSGMTTRADNYITWPFVTLCVALILSASAGAWLGENVRQRRFAYCDHASLLKAALALGMLVLASYLFWFRSLVFDPSMLGAVVSGAQKPDRDDIGTVAGITSLVNVAPVYFSIAGYLIFVSRHFSRALLALTGVLLAFTLFRTYIWSERLATIEAVVPLALAMIVGRAGRHARGAGRLVWWLGPYAALPFVIVFFAVAEYFRSWPWYQDRMTFWEFSVGRFASYYFTSLNNGAGTLATTSGWPDGSFQSVLHWLHKFPLGVGEQFSQAVGLAKFDGIWGPDPGDAFLLRLGDPEFNTRSSFASVTLDLGVGGALAYNFATMFASGILCTRYARGDLVGMMLFPAVLVALFECFRYPYWGQSRAFVWFLGAVGVLLVTWIAGAIRPKGLSREPQGSIPA